MITLKPTCNLVWLYRFLRCILIHAWGILLSLVSVSSGFNFTGPSNKSSVFNSSYVSQIFMREIGIKKKHFELDVCLLYPPQKMFTLEDKICPYEIIYNLSLSMFLSSSDHWRYWNWGSSKSYLLYTFYGFKIWGCNM